jgi:hypothetical protein
MACDPDTVLTIRREGDLGAGLTLFPRAERVRLTGEADWAVRRRLGQRRRLAWCLEEVARHLLGSCCVDLDLTRRNKGVKVKLQLPTVKLRVANLEPLSSLTALQRLSLKGQRVDDVGPLARLTNLEYLNLRHTFVKKLSGLEDLHRLKTLLLDKTPTTNLRPLSELACLRVLHLDKTFVTSISRLAGCTRLDTLHLAGSKLCGGAEGLPSSLRRLDLHKTLISELRGLACLVNLKQLNLGEHISVNGWVHVPCLP